MTADFSAKFGIALKSLNLSRGTVASAVGVDKSVVGRWAAGLVTPSDHNLSRLSEFIASRRAGFCKADWDVSAADFAQAFGVSAPAASPNSPSFPGFPPAFVERARELTVTKGRGYEGFWQTARPSLLMPDKVFRDHGMIRIDGNGYLTVRMGGAGMEFQGVILPAQANLFAIFYNSINFAPYFLIAKAVQLPRADVLEGLLLLSALDSAQTPACVPIVLERTGDLTGDPEADDSMCQELIRQPASIDSTELPDNVRDRLYRSIGDEAAAAGGDPFLMVAFGALSRGSTEGGGLRG